MDSDDSYIVQQVVNTMNSRPDLLNLSPFALECIGFYMTYSNVHQGTALPGSPTPNETSRLSSHNSSPRDGDTTPATLTSLHAVSNYERTWYYNGITNNGDHPPLLYRTGSDKYPFILPTDRVVSEPIKSLRGVHGTSLNNVWKIVGPQINALVKQTIKIRYSIDPACFLTHGENEDTLGPAVVWIAVYPGSTSADTAHDVSKDILALLKQHGVDDVEVEWHEAVTEKASGPALLPVVGSNDPTVNVRRHLTATLGIPIATAERAYEDAQGTIGFFFHENLDRKGMPSSKVYAVSSHHVLRKNDREMFRFRGAGAPRHYVRVCGCRRFQEGLDEIKLDIGDRSMSAESRAREIIALEQETGRDKDEEEENSEWLRTSRKELENEKRAIEVLEKFYTELTSQWADLKSRNIGYVHYSPPISAGVEGERYTEDWGTIELLEEKFKDQFKGNVMDLGTAVGIGELSLMISPEDGDDSPWQYPINRQLKINGIITREQLTDSELDSEDQFDLIVLKHGSATYLTVGRLAGLESFLCDEHGVESVELAIFNYDHTSGSFSGRGDSGSLIVDSQGRMVGLLHSRRSKSGGYSSAHATYATPAWWVIDRIKEKYPHADFHRTSW